jgi:DNA-binding transcriptional ArsR family regulator
MKSNDAHDPTGPEPAPDLQELIEAAKDLQNQGINVVPLGSITPEKKQPFLKEGELKDPPSGFFHRRSTAKDLKVWKTRDKLSRRQGANWRWRGLAIVTGNTSDVFVLDSDGPEGEDRIERYGDPPTWKSSTGKAYHRYYRIPEGMKISNKVKILPDLDIKGERGIAAAPPSLHYSGKRYRWVNSPFDTPLADPPGWLINTIKLIEGEGLTEEEYSSIPEEITQHLKERGTRGSSSGSGGGKVEGDSFLEVIPYGQRNDVLFRRACHYRHLRYEEEEIRERIWVDNQIYCEPDPDGELLSRAEIEDIARKACEYDKGDPAPVEVLKAIEGVKAYYLENPPKGMAAHTDQDITEAFLQEALLHPSIEEDGIEVSISYGALANTAGVSDSTVRKALNERLIPSGRFRRGKFPSGMHSGSLVLLSSFYAASAYSTPIDNNGVNRGLLNNNHGSSTPSLHKNSVDHVRSRWGKGKLGKARNHLMRRIEEAVRHIEGDLTPKKITEWLNEGVTDPEKMVKSTSISRHLSKLCEVGILERVRRGVYRLKEDRYKNLGEHMRETGEFHVIYKQRKCLQERQEAFRDFLESHEGEREIKHQGLLTWGMGQKKIEDSLESLEGEWGSKDKALWNRKRDWEEKEPYVRRALEQRQGSKDKR